MCKASKNEVGCDCCKRHLTPLQLGDRQSPLDLARPLRQSHYSLGGAENFFKPISNICTTTSSLVIPLIFCQFSIINLIENNEFTGFQEFSAPLSITPHAVADELANADGIASVQNILTLDWINVYPLTEIALAESLERDRRLDPGEAQAIALAIQIKATDLLIDERLGRQEAVSLGLSVTGILGILRVAKHQNLISVVKPVLDNLINQAGFRVSQPLYNQILQDENE